MWTIYNEFIRPKTPVVIRDLCMQTLQQWTTWDRDKDYALLNTLKSGILPNGTVRTKFHNKTVSEKVMYLLHAIPADKAGTPVPNDHREITFTSYGPGELLPQTWLGHPTGYTWNAIGGMTRIAFRSTGRRGKSVISAFG